MKIPVIVKNLTALAVLALVESLHVLIVLVLLLNGLDPLKYDAAIWNKYFPFLQSAIRPNHDFFLYHCWLAVVVLIFGFLMWLFRSRLEEEHLPQHMKAYLINEGVFLFLLLFAAFKIIVWSSPGWAWCLLYALLGISMVMRIFWPEARKAAGRVMPWITSEVPSLWLDLVMLGAIVLLIFPTDMDAILARIFIQEHFHHFDGVIMAPAWSYLSGCVLNVDILCEYGLGMTIAVAKLAQALGGFSYAHVLGVYIAATIVYFLAAYLLLRYWIKDIWLCAAGILLGIKFQMFHWGVASIIWAFLSATVVRYFFDIFFLFFILHHLRNRTWGLWAAAVCTAVSLAYMPDTGVYQWAALCVYLGFLLWEQRKISLGLYAILPVAAALLMMCLLAGPVFWTSPFWQGTVEQGSLFINGMGALPIYTNLAQGQFFAFFLGILIPVAYVFSLVYAGGQWALDPKKRENIFIVVLCVYGLGLYHYYICRSAPTSYHAVDLPFVFLLMFWAKELLTRMAMAWRRGIALAIFVLCLGGLLSNGFFIYYPNVLNLSRYDWSKEKAYFHQKFHYEADAQLIQRLTSPNEKVALISNSEVEILMEAHRKQIFYYFLPLSYPDPNYPDNFAATCLFTYARLKRTLDDLEKGSPKYVFVDAKFFRGELPRDVYQSHQALISLMDYLHQHYAESGQQGPYLLALLRKGQTK